jgi:hypothetical protein
MNHWNQKHWNYDENALLLESPDMWWKVVVQRDGCFELYKAHNEPFTEATPTKVCTGYADNFEADQIHICDVDDLIERLQSLKNQAMAHYGVHWPK